MPGPGHSIRVVAAAVVEAGRLLLVSKRAAAGVFYLPGGKPEPGESALGCLHRELAEELGVGLRHVGPLAVLRGPAALERLPMEMAVFAAGMDGPPRPCGEIARLVWASSADAVPGSVAPVVRDQLFPRLHAANRLVAAPV
jgi:8-oxo-dGTP diphosphatase